MVAATTTTTTKKTYKDMIADAITTLKERNGSSRQAIKKYIQANNDITANFDSLFNNALKKGVNSGNFAQPKGPSGPVKLVKISIESKKPAAAKPSKKAIVSTKKSAPKKAIVSAKKSSPKKPLAATSASKKNLKAKSAPKKAVVSSKKSAKTTKNSKTKKIVPKKTMTKKTVKKTK